MGNCINVHVIDADGDPVSGERVCILVTGEIPHVNDEFLEADTDYDGNAEFETSGDYYDGNPIRIMVGSHEEEQDIAGGSYTVQMD